MVFFAWAPYNLVLALLDVVLEPVKVHVNRFGAALFDGAIEDPPLHICCQCESGWEAVGAPGR